MMQASSRELVTIAEIGAAHGLQGALKLKLFGHGLDSLKKFPALNSQSKGSFTIKNARRGKNDSEAIATFNEVNDRTAAEGLRGVALTVLRSDLPETESDEFYHTDLIGLQVLNADDQSVLGTVLALHNFGAGDILEFTMDNGETPMHPFDQNFVSDVDLDAGTVSIMGFSTEIEPESDTESTSNT